MTGHGRNILLTTILRDKWELNEGDPITFILHGAAGKKSVRPTPSSDFLIIFFPVNGATD
jgi:hypothetical protein